MRYLLLITMFLTSCHKTKNAYHTVHVTYTNGDKGVLYATTLSGRDVYLIDGCLKASGIGVMACGVRNIDSKTKTIK